MNIQGLEDNLPKSPIHFGGKLRLLFTFLFSVVMLLFVFALSLPIRIMFPKQWKEQRNRAERDVIMRGLYSQRN